MIVQALYSIFEVTSYVWMGEDVVVVICAFFNYMNTIEFFHPKNQHFLKKIVNAGQIFIRKYSYLKVKFHLCIRKIISKLLFMQEPTNVELLKTKSLHQVNREIIDFIFIFILLPLLYNCSSSRLFDVFNNIITLHHA